MNPSHRAAGKLQALNVLVVDDCRDTADSLATLLRLWGYQSRAAYDAEDALRAATENVPNVVLMDLGLPGRTGFDLAADLRAQTLTREAKLYAVTGYSVLRGEALAGPFDDFLLKPVEPEALRQLLDVSRQPPTPPGGTPSAQT